MGLIENQKLTILKTTLLQVKRQIIIMSDIKLIDSHCHLIFENFEKDLEDVVVRLRSKGVKKLFMLVVN